MFARTPLAGATMALALLVAAPAAQAEEIVKEINVTADFSALADSNAQTYYPDIAADLTRAIAEKIELTDDPKGFVVDVEVQKVSLDGNTVLPDSREFNMLEGVIQITAPETNAPGYSYPVAVVAESASGAVPEGFIAIPPSTEDFYNGMIEGYAISVVERLPEALRNAGSK